MARRIKNAKIRFISLCEKGANQVPVLYKADGSFEFNPVVKANMDAGEITAIVYAPELRDSQGDIASASVIKDMAYHAMKSGLDIDIKHDFKPVGKDRAHIAESFLVQKGDPRFADMKDYDGNPIDVTGAWAVVVKVDDPELRKLYRDGKWNGVSMGGSGTVETEKNDDSTLDRILGAVAKMLGLTSNTPALAKADGDLDMDKAELSKTLADFKTDLLKEVCGTVKSLVQAQADEAVAKQAGVLDTDTPEVKAAKITLFKAKAPTPGTTAAPENKPQADAKPIFKGDISKAEDVAAFEMEVKRWEIMSKVDKSDPASLKKANEEIAALAGTKQPGADLTAEETAAGVLKTDGSDVRDLKIKLHKAQRASNQPGNPNPAAPGGNTPTHTTGISGIPLTKDQEAGIAAGNRMAAFLAGKN